MRKLYVLPIMLVIFSLILSACAAPVPQVIEKPNSHRRTRVQTQVVEKVVEKSVEVVVTATPEPPKPADANTLPRNETLYFNGQQWGPVVGWNPYSNSKTMPWRRAAGQRPRRHVRNPVPVQHARRQAVSAAGGWRLCVERCAH